MNKPVLFSAIGLIVAGCSTRHTVPSRLQSASAMDANAHQIRITMRGNVNEARVYEFSSPVDLVQVLEVTCGRRAAWSFNHVDVVRISNTPLGAGTYRVELRQLPTGEMMMANGDIVSVPWQF